MRCPRGAARPRSAVCGGSSSSTMGFVSKCLLLSQLVLALAGCSRAPPCPPCPPCHGSGLELPKRCAVESGGRRVRCAIGALSGDEARDRDRRVGPNRCRRSLVARCSIVEGKCSCSHVRSCEDLFAFATHDAYQAGLWRSREPSSATPAPPASDAMNNCTLSKANCICGFHLDRNGRPTCLCQTNETLCEVLIQRCTTGCHLDTQGESNSCVVCRCRTHPGHCSLPACRKDCSYGFQMSRRGCEVCHCKTCMEEECNKACPGGLRLSNRRCFTCHCTDPSAASFASPAEVGSCLSVDGRHHGEGEMWNDGCRQCYCHNGQEMCSLISCPATACATPVIQPGHCCPSCPHDLQTSQTSHRGDAKNLAVCLTSEGDHFAEGKTWSLDSCTQCICLAGKVLCETKTCPALLCQNPIRTQDSCCPQCPAEPGPPTPINRSSPGYCRDKRGRVFLEAQSWRLDSCSSCVCLDGAIKCFPESCPLVSCTKAVLHKGQCCPYCLGDTVSPAVCHFNGKTYADEERWNVDGCTHCYCLQGQTLCSTVSCPTPLCREPTQLGRCCPVCPEMNTSTSRLIAKTEHRLGSLMQRPIRPTGGNRGLLPLLGGHFSSIQHVQGRMPSVNAFRLAAWTTLPIVMVLATISALIAMGQRRKRLHIPCSNTSAQFGDVGCRKGVKVDSQRDLQPSDPDSRHINFYDVQQQNNLQADRFYQTV